MRLFRSFVVPLCIVPALGAQTPAQPPPRGPRVPVPVSRAVSADLAAARDHTARILVEPLVFGRVSVGFSGSYTDQAEVPRYPVPILYGDPYPGVPCPPNCYGPPGDPDYQAWSIDLNLRWYPALLSLNTPQAKAMLYVGEFIGFTQRRVRNTDYWYCPVCGMPVPLDSGGVVPNDSIIGGPYPTPWPPYPGTTQTFEAVEPGAEAGLRIQASRHAIFDVGGRWRLVRVDDPWSRKRPGQVDPRLVISAGLSW